MVLLLYKRNLKEMLFFKFTYVLAVLVLKLTVVLEGLKIREERKKRK